jgi:3'(2'), 5'-bisphosphate nucleotidase
MFENFDTNDAIVWVDPLDGTSDFIKGNLPAVTVCIGLSISGKSRAGVVHSPFSLED